MGEQQRLDIVCAAGLPGGGKTTICDALAASGDFHNEEVDDHTTKLFDEIKEAKDIGTLRDIFRRFLSSTRLPGFEGSKDIGRTVSTLLRMSDQQILAAFEIQPQLFGAIMGAAAKHQAILTGAAKTKEYGQHGGPRVLLPSAVFNTQVGRDIVLKYFPSQGITANILVVRARMTDLLDTAHKRVETGKVGRFIDRTNPQEALYQSAPVHPKEEWHSVHIVNNDRSKTPDEIADKLRARLKLCAESTIVQPVQFLI